MANDQKTDQEEASPYQPVFRNKRGPHLSARKGTQKDVPLSPNGEPRPKDMLARQALDTGRLVRPFDLATRIGPRLLSRDGPHRVGNPASLVFCDWLKSRLAQTTAVLHPA